MLKEIIFTDSIYSKKSEKVKILSVADMFADSIMRCLQQRVDQFTLRGLTNRLGTNGSS